MSKTKAIVWKWVAGICVSALLLWLLWWQSSGRLASMWHVDWWRTDTCIYGIVAFCLLPVNILLEARKWQMLLQDSTAPVSLWQSLTSVLTGITFSLVTPNRLGEYPGRLIALRRRFAPRLISVSILGATAQFIAVLAGGFAGGVFYGLHYHYYWVLVPFLLNLVILIAATGFYLRADLWVPRLERIRWLRKFARYGALLQAFSGRMQWQVLGISLLRFSVFTLQYYLALRWMGLNIPATDGLPLCALFFWVMAVVPSISLAEAGIRAEVSWKIFAPYGGDAGIVVAATMALWLFNLLLPAAAGALLILRLPATARKVVT